MADLKLKGKPASYFLVRGHDCITIRKYHENGICSEKDAHIELFRTAHIRIKQAQNRGIWRRTGPSESLDVFGEFVTAPNSNSRVSRGKLL